MTGSSKAFVRQRSLTVGALQALRVPGPLENLQDKSVQNYVTAAGAFGNRC